MFIFVMIGIDVDINSYKIILENTNYDCNKE